jgi:hypothetical protein
MQMDVATGARLSSHPTRAWSGIYIDKSIGLYVALDYVQHDATLSADFHISEQQLFEYIGTQLAQHQFIKNVGIADAAETARRVLTTLVAIRKDAAKSAQREQTQEKRVFKTTTCPRSSLRWSITLLEASLTPTAARITFLALF